MNPRRKISWKRTGLNALIVLISITLSLVVIEIGVRMFVEPTPSAAAPIFEADPDYIFRLRPGATLRRSVTTTEGVTTIIRDKISAQGLREDLIPPKGAGEFRILLLGDSFTLGGVTARAETIGGQLQSLIAERYPQQKVRVINLGVSGTGPWQQRGRLNQIGFGLEPDAVIHQLYVANDIGNTLTATSEYLDACIPEWEYSIGLWKMQQYRRFRVEFWLQVHSRAYGQLRSQIGRGAIVEFLCRDLPFASELTLPVAPKSAPRLDQIEVDLETWYPKLERGWAKMMEDIEGIAADFTQRNIRYATYNIPSYPALSDAEWSAQTEIRQSGPKYDRGKAERLTLEGLARRGIDAFSVFDALHAAGNPQEVFYVNQGHLAPKGNRIVAEQILSYIDRAGWFSKGAVENPSP